MTDTAPANIPAADQIVTRGHNSPPGLLPADDLLLKFTGDQDQPGSTADLAKDVATLLAEIGGRVDGIPSAPAVIETESDNGIVAAYMSRLRDTAKIIDRTHDAEKAPYLAAGRVVDNHFKGFGDRIEKAREILQVRGNAYTQRLVAEERARRNRELAQAAEVERLAASERQRLETEARDLEAAAQRARKPENVEKLTAKAETTLTQAAMAEVDHMIATSNADNAALAAAASSAAIARTRHSSGHLSTAKQVGYCEITDKTKLDFARLLPFIKEDALLAALKACAKIEGHKVPMDGAIIEFRDSASYR